MQIFPVVKKVAKKVFVFVENLDLDEDFHDDSLADLNTLDETDILTPAVRYRLIVEPALALCLALLSAKSGSIIEIQNQVPILIEKTGM